MASPDPVQAPASQSPHGRAQGHAHAHPPLRRGHHLGLRGRGHPLPHIQGPVPRHHVQRGAARRGVPPHAHRVAARRAGHRELPHAAGRRRHLHDHTGPDRRRRGGFVRRRHLRQLFRGGGLRMALGRGAARGHPAADAGRHMADSPGQPQGGRDFRLCPHQAHGPDAAHGRDSRQGHRGRARAGRLLEQRVHR